MERETIKISVRNLVEFILRSGDLEAGSGRIDVDAMQEGQRLHKKLQKRMGSFYTPEVPLQTEVPLTDQEGDFLLVLEGRADGILKNEPYVPDLREEEAFARYGTDGEYETAVVIDEIKTTYLEVSHLREAVPVHLAQAKCYAYIYAAQKELADISVQMTYCNVESEALKRFVSVYQWEELKEWFEALVKEYAKWASWQRSWKRERNASLKELVFPFPYREGQKELAAGVYRTLLREKKLFIEAPTGVGKTISTIFPAVKAVGEGQAEKLFYLTAKTIARTVAEDTFSLLLSQGMKYKVVTLTAKEKICVLDKPECSPVSCPRAKGHFDRVNDAVFDLLTHEEAITRELICHYAELHQVCPFEMCLDVTNFADAVICDYNYVFDPTVALKRFFAAEKKQPYLFLIDEAHNLVERAREMYSAVLYKEDFLTVKRFVQGKAQRLAKQLEACNKELLQRKRECEEFTVYQEVGTLVMALMRLTTEYEEYLQEENLTPEEKEPVLNLYFAVRHFLAMHDEMGEDYTIYGSYGEEGSFFVKLQCMNPARKVAACLEKGKSAVFFSATLLPVRYYMEQLGGTAEDYAVYAPSPFEKEKRLIAIGRDVSTRYARRGEAEYARIVEYIKTFTGAKTGNYLVFFSSYQMLHEVARLAEGTLSGVLLQKSNMTEEEKEAFLAAFTEEPVQTQIGFCVLGGIFGEGIDLKKDRLIGAVIVGAGLPLVCRERELFRSYYEEKNGNGFAYAYLYQGMNKVLQAAGRVIRTVWDKGAVLLLEERFLQKQYQELFPREWFPYETVTLATLEDTLQKFWEE